QPPEVGRVVRVAAHAGDLCAVAVDDHAAADTAVGAGGSRLGHVPHAVAVVASSTSSHTTPSSTCTRNRGTQPWSGATACPSASPMVQLCSGQATCSPNT